MEVLTFADISTRNNCIFLSKRYHKILTSEESFRWRLERMHIERGIYTPTEFGNKHSWKSIFVKQHKRRNLWNASQELSSENLDLRQVSRIETPQQKSLNTRISVCVRIKPKKSDLKQDTNEKVSLPLHQRLALIKVSNNMNSNREALSVLVQNGEWFNSKWAKTNKKRAIDGRNGYEMENGCASNVPQTSYHLNQGLHSVDTRTNTILAIDSTKGIREYNFDSVFDGTSSQTLIFDKAAKRLAGDLVNGFNCTLFTYGQTGSGKTYVTMKFNSIFEKQC